MFSGVEKGCIGNKWVKEDSCENLYASGDAQRCTAMHSDGPEIKSLPAKICKET